MRIDFSPPPEVFRAFEIPFDGGWLNPTTVDATDLFIRHRLESSYFAIQRVVKNIETALGFFRLLDDTLGRVVDILQKIKSLAVEAASSPSERRGLLQNILNEEVRNIAQLLNGFDFNGINPFRGDAFSVKYSPESGGYLVFNRSEKGTNPLIVDVSVGNTENEASRISLYNEGNTDEVALYVTDGSLGEYKLLLASIAGQNPQNLPSGVPIILPPIPIIPIPIIPIPIPLPIAPTPIPTPLPSNSTTTNNEILTFTFYVAGDRDNAENTVSEVERAIETFDLIRGFVGSLTNRLLESLEFQLELGDNLTAPFDDFLVSAYLSKFNWEKFLLEAEVGSLILTSYFQFQKYLIKVLFGL